MKKLLVIFLTGMFFASTGFGATLESLDKQATTKLFENRTMTTISMVTLNGTLASNTLTAYLGKDGKIVGQLANKPKQGPQGDKGIWAVKDDGSLCVTWENWENKKETCMNVYKTTNLIAFVNTANGKFESGALINYFKDGDQMN